MKKFFAMCLLCSLIGCGYGYSEGSRVGVITKFSKKGVFVKSWEGEMLIALPEESSAINAESFAFTVRIDNPKVVKQVHEAQLSGKRVEIEYKQWLCAPPTIDTEYEVERVNTSSF